MDTKFKPRTSHGNVWMFYAVIAFFTILFIFLLPVDEEPMLWIVFGFLIFVFLIIFIQAAALPYGYAVGDDGVVVSNYSKKFIPFTGIKFIRKLDQNRTTLLLETLRSKQMKASNELDFLASFNSLLNYGKVIQYCSFQIVNQDSKVGRKITKVEATTKGDFVIIGSGDDLFLVSPEDPDGFVMEVEGKLK